MTSSVVRVDGRPSVWVFTFVSQPFDDIGLYPVRVNISTPLQVSVRLSNGGGCALQCIWRGQNICPPHSTQAFRKLAAMHLNRCIIIMAVTSACGVGAGPRPLSPDDPGQLNP